MLPSLDLEKDLARAKPCEPAQMQFQQAPCQSAPAPSQPPPPATESISASSNTSRERMKPARTAPTHRPVREHRAIDSASCSISPSLPTAREGGAMQRGDRAGHQAHAPPTARARRARADAARMRSSAQQPPTVLAAALQERAGKAASAVRVQVRLAAPEPRHPSQSGGHRAALPIPAAVPSSATMPRSPARPSRRGASAQSLRAISASRSDATRGVTSVRPEVAEHLQINICRGGHRSRSRRRARRRWRCRVRQAAASVESPIAVFPGSQCNARGPLKCRRAGR